MLLSQRQHLTIPFGKKRDEQEKAHIPKRKASVLMPLCYQHGETSLLYTLRSSHVRTHKNQVSFPGGHVEHGESSLYAALREFHEECGCYFYVNILNPNEYNMNDNCEWLDKEDSQLVETQPFAINKDNLNNLKIPIIKNCDRKDIKIDEQLYANYTITVNILGTLFDYVPSRHGSHVTPFVAYIEIEKCGTQSIDINSGVDAGGEIELLKFMDPQSSEVEKAFVVSLNTLADENVHSCDQFKRDDQIFKIKRYKVNPQTIWGFTAFLTSELMSKVIVPLSIIKSNNNN